MRQLEQRRRRHGATRPSRSHGGRQYLVERHAPEPWLQPGEPGGDRRRGAAVLLCDQLTRGSLQSLTGIGRESRCTIRAKTLTPNPVRGVLLSAGILWVGVAGPVNRALHAQGARPAA